MPRTLDALITSEPFVKGMIQEFGSPGAAYKVLSQLRSGVAGQRGAGNDEELRQRLLSEQQP